MASDRIADLREFVLRWLSLELQENKPKMLLLDGKMGAGKTTFTVLLAEHLGAPDAASPSFALHSRYEGPRGVIDHFDLDRLQSEDDLASIGFWDQVTQASLESRNFVVIEWASKLEEFGFQVEKSIWTKAFRVWRIKFSGQPDWQIRAELLQP